MRKITYYRLFPWLLILPALLLRCFTSLYPLIQNFLISLTNLHYVRGTNEFVGLANYMSLFSDSKVIDSLVFTLIFTGLSTGLHFLIGILIALLLNLNWQIKGLLRTVNLLPWAIPTIVMALAAQYMFQKDIGLVNDIYSLFTSQRPDWLGSVWGARMAVVAVDVWKNVPFLAIVVLAGLQGIPEEIKEAAKIDGASSLKSFFHITLPLISPTLVTMLIFVSLSRLFSFDIVYGMTKGGPGTATSLLSYRTYYDAFNALNFGYAAAEAFLLFILVAIVGMIGFALLRLFEKKYD